MRRGFPLAYPGMRIGVFGGTFNPAHSGHRHVAETALARLGLDRVWWLVTPQNPLKPYSRPLEARMMSAAAQTRGPAMIVTDIESRLGVRYTADTLDRLREIYPGVRFTWIMGADNLLSFHRWQRWRDILAKTPVAVVARPGAGPRARLALPFATGRARITFIASRWDPSSSTALRARGVVA